MMIRAYDKLYLSDFMDELGGAFHFVSVHCSMPVKEFGDRFVASGIAAQIERGNPTYLAGLSGIELAMRIVERTGGTIPDTHSYFIQNPGPEYWTGWILAYLQWSTGYSFDFLFTHGCDPESVIAKYYPYHEASEDKFVDESVRSFNSAVTSRLRQLRRAAGLTQKELAERSGVKQRMIQAYEQGYQNICRAEAASVHALARVLGCTGESLLY